MENTWSSLEASLISKSRSTTSKTTRCLPCPKQNSNAKKKNLSQSVSTQRPRMSSACFHIQGFIFTSLCPHFWLQANKNILMTMKATPHSLKKPSGLNWLSSKLKTSLMDPSTKGLRWHHWSGTSMVVSLSAQTPKNFSKLPRIIRKWSKPWT